MLGWGGGEVCCGVFVRIGILVGVLVGFVDGGVCVTSCWVSTGIVV